MTITLNLKKLDSQAGNFYDDYSQIVELDYDDIIFELLNHPKGLAALKVALENL